jgi:hypothetical protein
MLHRTLWAGGMAQLVEHLLPKLSPGSNPGGGGGGGRVRAREEIPLPKATYKSMHYAISVAVILSEQLQKTPEVRNEVSFGAGGELSRRVLATLSEVLGLTASTKKKT